MKYFLFIIFFIVGCSSVKETGKTIEYIQKDSIEIITKPNIVYKNDTILTHSFIYTYDTVIANTFFNNKIKKTTYDTIKIKYEFPENNLKLKINSTPDTIFSIVKEKSIFTTTEKILTAVLIILLIIYIIATMKK